MYVIFTVAYKTLFKYKQNFRAYPVYYYYYYYYYY